MSIGKLRPDGLKITDDVSVEVVDCRRKKYQPTDGPAIVTDLFHLDQGFGFPVMYQLDDANLLLRKGLVITN